MSTNEQYTSIASRGEAVATSISQDDAMRLRTFLHFSIEHLYGPKKVSYAPDELGVVCLVRNGRPYVRSFVEHYLSLGVKHIFFLDNGSNDGTISVARGYENVTILQTQLPYKGHDYAMKQYLIDRFGKGRWCLCADIDELFDYPYSDVVGLGSLLGYLNSKSYTSLAAQMLDMFPEEPLIGRESNNLTDEPLKERHRFYDISNIRRKSFKNLRRRFPNNALGSEEIELFTGGIRDTIFATDTSLTKHPLVFSDGRIKPMADSAHWVDNARIADFTCVLYHYKFLDGYFHKQAAQAVKEGQYNNITPVYKKYLQVLEGNPSLQIKQESAREIESVNDLVDDGFLVVSEDYMVRVYEEEEANKKEPGRAGSRLRGESGEPEEDEAVIRRLRAQAEVQGLKVKRLERHLKELREQNRREVQRLSSTVVMMRKKNRNLTRQLQNIQSSRSFKLLNKLGGIKARLRARKLRRA
jgi:Glycosyl transferase family 2